MITLKKLKIYERLSEETTCFTAEIYFDGKLVGSAENRGHGGCSNAHPAFGKDEGKYASIRAAFNEAEAWAKTQPDECQKSLNEDPSFIAMLAARGEAPEADPRHDSIASYVDQMVESEANRKRLASFISRNARAAQKKGAILGFRRDGDEDKLMSFRDSPNGLAALANVSPPLLSLAGLEPAAAVEKVEEYLASLKKTAA